MDSKLTRFLKKRNDRRGMTLIEVMIAVVLLSLILIAVISLTNISITGVFSAGEKSKAIAAAMEKSDQVYSGIVSAKDIEEAEAKIRSLCGYVESSLYLSSVVTEPQFYCEKRTYDVDGFYSEGFDVTVVVYYNGGRSNVEIKSFVLKSPGDK